MKNFRRFMIIVAISVGLSYFIATALMSRGDTYLVDSDLALEDIVVVCKWSSTSRTLHGGYSIVRGKSLIVKSGEKFNCGYNLLAGFNFSFDSYISLMHPTYVFERIEDFKYEAKNKLNIINKKKSEFEISSKAQDPVSKNNYIKNISLCGLGHKYIDYYIESRNPDVKHFIDIYNADLVKCFSLFDYERKKYDPYFSNKSLTPSKKVDLYWEKIREGIS